MSDDTLIALDLMAERDRLRECLGVEKVLADSLTSEKKLLLAQIERLTWRECPPSIYYAGTGAAMVTRCRHCRRLKGQGHDYNCPAIEAK